MYGLLHTSGFIIVGDVQGHMYKFSQLKHVLEMEKIEINIFLLVLIY